MLCIYFELFVYLVIVGLIKLYDFEIKLYYFEHVVVQLHIFVQLQQDIQAKYPDFLAAVVSKIMPSMTQMPDENDCCQRLFTNFIHLCQWNSIPDTQQSARYVR